jgi:4-hydroxybutyrate dehydrogenase
MGVTGEMMRHVAQDAMKDHCHATNPRTPTAEDYLALLKDSA